MSFPVLPSTPMTEISASILALRNDMLVCLNTEVLVAGTDFISVSVTVFIGLKCVLVLDHYDICDSNTYCIGKKTSVTVLSFPLRILPYNTNPAG